MHDRSQPTGENCPSVLTIWLYDAAGRQTQQLVGAARTTYAFDAADQLLAATTGALITTSLYDQNGSTAGIQTPNGQRTSYAWDPANRLSVTQLPAGSRTTETYRFDDLRVAQSGPSGIQTFTRA